MWNSPVKLSDSGKQYHLKDISALLLSLDELFHNSKSMPIAELVDERILKRLERSEFIWVLYQVLEALLEEVPIPEGGHTGIQEAMVAELLSQAHGKVCCEMDFEKMDDPEFEDFARKSVWNSVDRLLIHRDPNAPEPPWDPAEEIGLDLSEAQPYLSEKMTFEAWEALVGDARSLFAEFLWDDDWRLDSLMDLSPEKAEETSQVLGLNLDVVQALPHTPNDEELRIAEDYILHVMRKNEEVWA